MRPVSNYGLVLIFESTFVTLHILVESLPLKLPAYRSARCLLPSMPDNMDSLPTPATRAEVFWQEAKKIRHKILRDIEQLKKGSGGKTEEEQLKSLEESMAQYVISLLARRQKMSHA